MMKFFRFRTLSLPPFGLEFKDYGLKSLRADLMAALAVALLTIPQSIAYSLLAGLPPMAGLFSAIFGTILTASFGSSRHLISGPSTGIAILIQTTIADVLYNYYETVTGAARDALTLELLTQIVFVMGVIQIAAAVFNVRKLLQFVSRPVMLGYFGGITIAIIISQFYYLLGIESPQGDDPVIAKAIHLISHLKALSPASILVGIGTLVILFLFRRGFKNWPDALFALVAGTLIAEAFKYFGHEIGLQNLGDLNPTGKPDFAFHFPPLDLKALNRIFPGAVAISFLAILEIFSVSRTFAARSGQVVQVNQDVLGLGIGNFFLSFLSGSLPCSGSATRTALNFRMGAATRLAAIFSGCLVAFIIYLCWPLVQHIPLAALAALLIATVPTLNNFQEVKLSFRATREDAWVFIITFLSCLIFSLDIAFFIGIVISIATYLKKSSEPHLVEYAFNGKGRLMIVSSKELANRRIRIIGIGGELYFAAADFFQNAMMSVVEDPAVEAVVLRLNNVHHMDASMCLAIIRLQEMLQVKGCYLLISGLTEEVWHVLHRAGLVKQLGLDNLYFTDESNPQFSTWKACLRAQELIYKKDKKNP